MSQSAAAYRRVCLCRNSHNQAIRIPVEFELPGSAAITSRDGDRVIIAPFCKKGLAALLDSWQKLDYAFPEINDPPPVSEDVF